MIKVIVKKIWRSPLVRSVVITADVLSTLGLNFLLILHELQKIVGKKRVVVLTEGGFGHTVSAPDIARRVFPDQKTLVIIFSIKGRHNWCLAKAWTDIDVMHLWKFLYFYSRLQSVHLPHVVLWILRFLLRKQVYMVTEDPEWKEARLHARWIEPVSLYKTFVKLQMDRYGVICQPQPHNPVNEFLLYWVRCVFLNPMPQPSLPRALEKSFMLKMEEIQPDRGGVLAVYMRRKGESGDGLVRCGGDYEDYRPIFETARRRGLLVLVLGDRPLEECPSDIRGYLKDARSFGLDNDWFSLAAVLKSDYFVGDPGGGSLLPCLMRMPKVMVNAFPYSQAWPGFLQLFKRLTDSEGGRISLARCFNEYPWTYDFGTEYVLSNNTSAELAAAMDELFRVPAVNWRDYIAESNFELMGSYARQGARVCEVQSMDVDGLG